MLCAVSTAPPFPAADPLGEALHVLRALVVKLLLLFLNR